MNDINFCATFLRFWLQGRRIPAIISNWFQIGGSHKSTNTSTILAIVFIHYMHSLGIIQIKKGAGAGSFIRLLRFFIFCC